MASSAEAASVLPRGLAAHVRFLRVLLQQPRETGSIVPSSAHLGRLMASQIVPDAGPCIELGGGTGALTREILATGLPATSLEVLEMNAHFASALRSAFPAVTVHEGRAEAAATFAAHGFSGYQAVISGLPLLAMDAEQQHAILAAAIGLLAPGGRIVQFTYSPRPPVRRCVREALGIEIHRVGSIWRNLPPATVFAMAAAGH